MVRVKPPTGVRTRDLPVAGELAPPAEPRTATPPSCSAQPAAGGPHGGTSRRAPLDGGRQQRRQDGGSHGPCAPRDGIVFLKTHKTASSTVLNILFRLGEKRHLRFAFPNGKNDFDYPSPFSRYRVAGYSPGRCYDVVCSHMRFSRAELEPLLPPGAAFFTIMRDPARVFESSFHYYRAVVPSSWRVRGDDPMREFLRDPRGYYDPASVNSHYLKNLQAFDMGFDNNAVLSRDDGGDSGSDGDRQEEEEEEDIARRMIREAEDTFSLVMISEHFDESLVLLKELLCLDEEDITYFRLNARSTSMASRGGQGGGGGGAAGGGGGAGGGASRGTGGSGAGRTPGAGGTRAGEGDGERGTEADTGGVIGGDDGRSDGLGRSTGGNDGADEVAGASAAAADAPRMDPDTYRRARRWNHLDSLLYEHFNRSLWREVARFGEGRMRAAVASLRRRNAALALECTEEGGAVDASAVRDPALRPWRPIGSQPIMGYNLRRGIPRGATRRACRRMLTPELQYMSELGANLWITKLWVRLTQLLQW
uniref:Galactosylceramide sulfotransferase n=1 Tax=Petromyzon marinus TaxID=7757 RepID=A0AAJ7SQJ2_PETMA|nr:galactosylceramide sulfotransferase [Petromyzon marinus]